MNTTNKTVLIIAIIVVIVLFLIFGSGALTGATWGGGMMGNGLMGGIRWMWIPTVIILGNGILLGWAIFGKNKLPIGGSRKHTPQDARRIKTFIQQLKAA